MNSCLYTITFNIEKGKLMLTELVRLCDERYQSHRCESCSYGIYCPHDCGKCLEYIHFPQRAPAERKYDCKRMMDYYVCKYAHKYTSELIYAFSMLRNLQMKRHLNILSIGCGPCTDLLALDYLQKKRTYSFSTIDYCGVELNTGIWSNIYDDIFSMVPCDWGVKIISDDICNYIEILLQQSWKPNLIVLQYVFSDMHKHTPPQMIENMIKSLAQYVDSCANDTYVVCNDINLSTDYNGGREYFDRLYRGICTQATPYRFHFNNSNKPRHYNYGEEYESNELIVLPDDELAYYQPYKSCASAQMIIYKGGVV